MRIVVNGETKDVAEPTSVAALIEALALHPRRVAVERNKLLVPRAKFSETALAEGDCLEIVTLVGGG